MTVGELITLLQKVENQDRQVCCYDDIAGPWVVKSITLIDSAPEYGEEFNTPALSFSPVDPNRVYT